MHLGPISAELMNASDHPSRLNPSDSFSETAKAVSNSPATITIAHATAGLLASIETTVPENWYSRTNRPGCVALQRVAGDGAGHAPRSDLGGADERQRPPQPAEPLRQLQRDREGRLEQSGHDHHRPRHCRPPRLD